MSSFSSSQARQLRLQGLKVLRATGLKDPSKNHETTFVYVFRLESPCQCKDMERAQKSSFIDENGGIRVDEDIKPNT